MNQSELRERRVAEVREKREQSTKRFMSSLDAARKRYDLEVKTLDARLAKLDAVSNDPVVLVRRSPGIAPVAHSAEHPCGKVPKPGWRSHYQEMFLGEALAEKINTCRFCGYGLKVAHSEAS